MMMNKSHISSMRKHTGSKGCTKSQECYQIKKNLMFNQTFENNNQGSFVQIEPYQIDQIRSNKSYIVRQLFHNGPVLQSRPS